MPSYPNPPIAQKSYAQVWGRSPRRQSPQVTAPLLDLIDRYRPPAPKTVNPENARSGLRSIGTTPGSGLPFGHERTNIESGPINGAGHPGVRIRDAVETAATRAAGNDGRARASRSASDWRRNGQFGITPRCLRPLQSAGTLRREKAMRPWNTDTLTSFSASVSAFQEGRDSPRSFLERCLEVIDAREPEVKAFVTVNADAARPPPTRRPRGIARAVPSLPWTVVRSG